MSVWNPTTGHTADPTCHHSDKMTPGVCGKKKVHIEDLHLCPTCDERTINTMKHNNEETR